MDGTQLGGRTLNVHEARPRPERLPRAGGARRRRGIAGKEPGLTGDGINVAQLLDGFNCLDHIKLPKLAEGSVDQSPQAASLLFTRSFGWAWPHRLRSALKGPLDTGVSRFPLAPEDS